MSIENEIATADTVVVLLIITVLSGVVMAAISKLIMVKCVKLDVDVDFTYIPAHHSLPAAYVANIFLHAYSRGMPIEMLQLILDTEGDRGYRTEALLKYVSASRYDVTSCVDMCTLYSKHITIKEI